MQHPLPKSSFVVSYDDAEKKLSVFVVKDSDIQSFKESTVVADWPLSAIGDELGEEVARRLGITALNVLAIYHPALKSRVTVKLEQPMVPDRDVGP
ncbi:hypothetical protein [Paraburkholderia caribensis]|uniref:hypothetical protein n=1 Tax=Paraburkholderia caribensis TaxID=75105 RepID=UPI001D08D948|nr:hypothetical protein [Paraburkholderia caribensis]